MSTSWTGRSESASVDLLNRQVSSSIIHSDRQTFDFLHFDCEQGIPTRQSQGLNNQDDESLDHVVMAVHKSSNGTIGCAYYIAREAMLCCVGDIEKAGAEVIQCLKLDLQPTVLIVSPKVEDDEALEEAIRRRTTTDDNDVLPPPYEYLVRPVTDFSYETAINTLCLLPALKSATTHLLIPGEGFQPDGDIDIENLGMTDEPNKLFQLHNHIDLDNRIGIGCMGVVVTYLARKRVSSHHVNDEDMSSAYPISYICMRSLKDTMLVNADTLVSLQIVEPEAHLNTLKQGPGAAGSKKSLSIYRLFRQLAKTPQGKTKLRRLFLQPSTNVSIIVARHEFISLCVQSANQVITEKLRKSLSKIKNLRTTIIKLHKGVETGHHQPSTLKFGVWSTLLEFCYHALDIHDIIQELDGYRSVNFCNHLMEEMDVETIREVGKLINDIIDIDLSMKECRTVIKEGIDENLDKVRCTYNSIGGILHEVAEEIATAVPPDVEEYLQVVFIPQLGYHIAIPLHDGHLTWFEGNESWQCMFTTEEFVYFKNAKTRELDHHLGDLYSVICDTEIEIAHQLAQNILQHEEVLVKSSDICGDLDCLLALALGAIRYRLCRPRIVHEPVINIKGGRHILQEMTVPCFVPNDTILVGGGSRSMAIITGPNYSGKSVYLKQVALIVYMAQIGSFVPAESATIGITDKILTRITTRETVAKQYSAFMIDLKQISFTLNNCTPKSLVIVDEFGKGTDSCDGAGLVAAIFNHFLSLGTSCPRILASTHHHEIFEDGHLDNLTNVVFEHMRFRLDTKTGDDIVYLYSLEGGRCKTSYGNQCAALSGIPATIVKRAAVLNELVIQGEDLVAACAELPEAEIQEYEEAERVARTFIEMNLDEGILLDDLF